MSESRFDIFAFDADGCLYNLKYTNLLVTIINRYANFFLKYGKNKDITEEDVKEIKAKCAEIIDKINACTISEEIKEPSHVGFSKRVKQARSAAKILGNKNPRLAGLLAALPAFIACMNNIDPEILATIFLKANESLINDICNKIKDENIKNFAYVTFSNRGSHYHDDAGMQKNGTGSIYLDLDVLLAATLKRLENVNGVVGRFCMADILGNYKRGESYRKICEEHRNKSQQPLYTDHGGYLFDENKFSVLYAIGHDVPNITKEAGIEYNDCEEINLYCFDDRVEILNTLDSIGKLTSDFLPDKVICELNHYAGNELTPVGTIKGTGVLDKNYPSNVKLIATMYGFDLENKEVSAASFDPAAELDFKQFLSLRVTSDEKYKGNDSPTLFYQNKIELPKLASQLTNNNNNNNNYHWNGRSMVAHK